MINNVLIGIIIWLEKLVWENKAMGRMNNISLANDLIDSDTISMLYQWDGVNLMHCSNSICRLILYDINSIKFLLHCMALDSKYTGISMNTTVLFPVA